MKAWTMHQYGDPDVVQLEDMPTPQPGAADVLVRIESAAVNPLDNKLVSGAVREHFPVKFPYVPGMDVAGTVEAVGADAGAWTLGDRVFFKCGGGGFAEHVAVPASTLARLPGAVSFADGAAVATAGGTAWEALMEQAGLKAGQKVLIHAGSGGVGHLAVQFAKLAGAHVIATSSAANLALLRELGADEAIDYKADDFTKKVSDVDVVLDPMGGETQRKSIGVLREGGILVSLVQPPDAKLLAQRQVRGLMMSHQPSAERLERIAALLADGKIRIVTEATFPFAKVPEALACVSTGQAKGKVVVDVA